MASIYLPIGNIEGMNAKLKKGIGRLEVPKVGGDLNRHHPWWGCSRADTRETEIQDLLEEQDMTILSNGQPTFFNGRHQTAIDVTAVIRS